MKRWLVLVCVVTFSQFVFGRGYGSDTILSESGLLFVKDSDIIITGDSWTIILPLHVTQHLNSAKNIKGKVEKLQKNSGIDELEMDRLLRVSDQLVEVTDAIADILSKHKRLKRSWRYWVPFIAPSIIDLVFRSNSGSEEEIQLIKYILEKIESQQTSQKQLLDSHITFTNKLDEKVQNNLERINNLTEIIIDEFISIDKQFRNVENNFKIMEERIKTLNKTTTSLRILEVESLHSLIMASRLQHALEMAGEGKLSFYLLSPKELQKELITISSLLPIGSKLLRGLSVEDMYKYREMAKVTVLANAEMIFIGITLPLITIETSFTSYSVKVMPVFVEELEHAVKVEPESKYIVVSNDKQLYGLPDSDYFQKCFGKNPMICPADILLKSRYLPSCVGASYFGNKNQIGNSCNKKLVVNGEEFAWIQDKENRGWIYSLKNETIVTLSCHEKISLAKTIKLNKGFGYLSNTSHCRIIGDDFKLLKASASGMSLKDGHETYLIKHLDHNQLSHNIFSSDERFLLSNFTRISTTIDKIKQNYRIKKDTSKSFEIPIDDLLNDNVVQSERLVSQYYNQGSSIIALIIITVVISVVSSQLVVTLFLKFYIFRKLKASTNSPVLSLNPTQAREPLYSNYNPFVQKPLLDSNNISLIDN